MESVKKVVKRALEDGEEAIEEAAEDVLEEGRAIATNSRAAVPQGRAVQTIKQAAWGAFVFGVGLGATSVHLRTVLLCIIRARLTGRQTRPTNSTILPRFLF